MSQPLDPNQPPPYGAPPPPPPPPPYGAPPPPAYGGAAYGGYGPPPGQRVNDPAPMGMRLLARILDGLLVGVVASGIAYAAGVHFIHFSSSNGTSHGSFALYGNDYWRVIGINLVVSALYEVTMLTSRGATLGKMAVGVRVARIEDGTNPTAQAAFIRWVIPAVAAAIIPFFGWIVDLSPFFDSTHRNRGWYDYAAKTIAVRTR